MMTIAALIYLASFSDRLIVLLTNGDAYFEWSKLSSC